MAQIVPACSVMTATLRGTWPGRAGVAWTGVRLRSTIEAEEGKHMSMMRVDPPESGVIPTIKQAGAGAAVVVIAVVAVFLVVKALVAALITLAALAAIGAILYLVFLRGRVRRGF
jgi:hypothetical protein